MQIFTADLVEFETGFNFIEPILCSSFIISDGKILTHPWNFIPNQTIPFFESQSLKVFPNHKAAFHYRTINKTCYLVVFLKRVTQPKNGTACNSYYEKSNNTNTNEALKSLKFSWPHNSDTFSVFAWTYAPILDIVASPDGLSLPTPIALNDSFNFDQLDSYIKNSTSNKNMTFNIKIKIKSSIKNVINQYTLINDGFTFLPSLLPIDNEPSLRFRHSLYLTIYEAKLKIPNNQIKNVYVEVSYQVNKNKLKIIHDTYKKELNETSKTICSFNIKHPIFNNVFNIFIPPLIEVNSFIVFDFYTIPFPKDINNEKTVPQLIGTSSIPLFNEEGKFLKNGFYNSNIEFNNNIINNGNNESNLSKIYFNVNFDSSLVVNSGFLNKFFTNSNEEIDFNIFERIQPEIITQNLFQIIDLLLSNIIKYPFEVFNSFLIITTKVIPIYSDFEQFLLSFVNYYSLINPKDHKVEFHHSIFKGWIQQIETSHEVNSSERYDLYYTEFFFLLIIKSIIITKDKNFSNDLMEFINIWDKSIIPLCRTGLIYAKKATESYAKFILLLFDIGFYSLSLKCIFLYINAFGETPNEHIVIIDFLTNVLHPKLFVSNMLFNPLIKEIILNITKRSTINEDNSVSMPLQKIFNVLLCICSTFETDKEITKIICDNLIDVLTSLNPISIIPFINNNENKQILIFFCYIILHIDINSFKKWWENANKKEFFNSLNFLLDKIRLKPKNNKEGNSLHSSINFKDIENSFMNLNKRNSLNNSRSFIVKYRYSASNNNITSDFTKEKVKNEIFYSTHLSIIHILNILNEINKIEKNLQNTLFYNPLNPELSHFSQITKIIYHLLSINTSIDCIYPIINLLCDIAKSRIDLLFTQCCPVLPKILFVLIQQLKYEPESNKFINQLFETDYKLYKNNNRCNIIFSRTLSLFHHENFQNLLLITNKNVKKQCEKIYKILNKLNEENLTSEKYAYLLYKKSFILKTSPDSQLECLTELAQYHQSNEYYEEEIQVLILQASIIFEYLVRLKKLKGELWKYDKHTALQFKDICSVISNDAICPDIIWNDIPNINCFCDSQMFNIYSLVNLLTKIINRCRDTGIYEIALFLIDHLWPLLEKYRSFNTLREIILTESEVLNSLSLIPTNEDRLFGHYFKVTFFGEIFKKNNNQTFVYREKKLTHLYEFSSRIKNLYSLKFGEENIELIKESSTVNIEKLNPSKGYIQITFINPYLKKEEQKKRHTLFEQCHNLSYFSYDTPFIQGESNKNQGNIEQQMLLKTIIPLKFKMPYVLKTQKIDSEKIRTTVIQPIRVSYRQLRERITMLRNAIERNDVQQIQQLIHGSLLVQVNEGPSKMAEVFLKKDKNSERTKFLEKKNENDKYVEKLKAAFHEFLEVNEKGLKMHAKWVCEHTDFVPLQQELESGFNTLKEKLNQYI